MAPTFDGPLLEDRWRLGPRLGVGSQGHTYIARDERAKDGRVVVVKELRLGEAGWKKFELFEREARVLRQLSHPGIPRVLSSFEGEQGTFYLVMERAPGASLRAIATKVRFDDRDLRDILRQVLEILAYLHERRPPVIHRDIKPANLVRSAEGKMSLVDFGGVREALREGGGTTVVGTFGYMAPEQLHGEARAATDLYALGATIVALASGVEPEKVPRKGLRMDLERHLRGMAPDLLALLSRMTEPEPEKRPESARAALAELDARRVPAAAQAPATAEAAGGTIHAFDEDFDFDDRSLPGPARAAMRVLMLVVATFGWVAVTVADQAIVPLVFALIRAFAKEDTKKQITSAENAVHSALGQGRAGFRRLQQRAARRPQRPPLPPPPQRPALRGRRR